MKKNNNKWATPLVLSLLFSLAAGDLVWAQEFVRSSQYVKVRDGTPLAMNVYRPARNGVAIEQPMPVVFMFTPYRARFKAENGEVRQLSQLRGLGLDRLFAAGYVVAEADVRGKGASFGARRGFQDRTEAYDGYDLVQWLAAQPWSSGVVGMVGCSYLGGTTVQVATTKPPALKAIFTGASDLDKFDFVRRGGITAQFNTRPDEPLSDDLMSLPMDEDKDGSLLREAVAQHANNTSMAQLWYGMPFRDSTSTLTDSRFWEEVGPYTYLEDLKKSGIATYFWSNLKDEPTSQVILAAANLGSKLLVGPGSHCAAPPNYDIGSEILRYFDFHLKSIENGFDKEPRTTLWVENAPIGQEWKRSNRLPGENSVRQVWHLNPAANADSRIAGGVLSVEPTGSGQTRFTVDYDVGSKEYFAFWVQSQAQHGPTFSTAPLAKDLHLEGYPLAKLRISADKGEVNVFAYLEEEDPQGQVSVLAMGRLNSSYRKTAEAPYDTMGLPWHPGRKSDQLPLKVGEPADLEIVLLPVSHIVPAGHRLRLTVTGADPRQRNLEQISQNPPPVITFHIGERNASRLELPVQE